MAIRWSPDFLDLLTALNAADARYLLVGGHAIGLFARPRATKDFDLWVEASAENATRVLLTSIAGVEFEAAWPRREEHDLDGVRCLAYVRALERASKK